MTTVDLHVGDGPRWMSHVEVSRTDDGRIRLRLVKHSGEDYGSAIVNEEKLRKILDLL